MERVTTMKKVYAMMAASLLVAAAATSCSEKEDVATGDDSQYVDFSVGGGTTRTVRDEANKYQINWDFTNTDKVRVYSDKATTSGGKNFADYEVKESDVSPSAKNKGKLQGHDDGLCWTEERQQHKFYAVYPADDSRVLGADFEKGTITFKAQTNQKVVVTSSTERTEAGLTRHDYVCAPVMENAYMVATATAYNSEKVALTFEPVTTTLDITVKNNNENNSEDDGTITVLGVSVIDENASGDNEYVYDVNTKGLAGTKTATEDAKSTQTTYVSFQTKDSDGNDQYYLDLKHTESVKFTVFLPPVAVNADRQLKLRVHCTGGTPEITIGGDANKDKSDKAISFNARDLGNVKINIKNPESNNWITPLDGDILVQQLSIPGTNEAISYLAQTAKYVKQNKTIKQQLAMGIRAFDVHTNHPGLMGSSFNLYANGSSLNDMAKYDGSGSSDATLRALLTEQFIPFLKENKGEFIFMFLTENSRWTNLYQRLNADLRDDADADYTVTWKPELTIDDCRGKVIVMARDVNNQDNMSSWMVYATDNFSSTTSEVKSLDLYVNEKVQGTLYYFARNSGGNYTTGTESDGEPTRFKYVRNMLETVKTATGTPWCLTYMAGASNDEKSGYLANAELMHPYFFNWANKQTTFGPFGIVFMDFVGSRKTDDVTTYGDLLPQAIIDNNYRFTMKRGNK